MEKSKRFIDILPPKKREIVSKEKKSKPFPTGDFPKGNKASKRTKFPRLVIGTALLVLLCAGGAFSLQLFFARASVLVWPYLRQIELAQEIEAKTSQQEVSSEDKSVPAKLFEQEKSLTRLFPASGLKLVETKASGVVTVFNKRDVPQILVAHTRFISEGGRLFRSSQKVIVPAALGSIPGSLNVQVTAAEGGEEYNISPSTFSLPGLAGSPLYTVIYGKSEKAMSGGSKIDQVIVTKFDIENARETLISDATSLAKDALLASIPSSYTLSDESITTRVQDSSTVVKEGAALKQFSFTAKVGARALVFAQSDLEELSREFLTKSIKEGEGIVEATFHAVYTVDAIDMRTGVISLEGDIAASAYLEPSFEELKKSLAGKKKGQAEALLLADPTVARFSISLWPFWVQTIPQDPEKVRVLLQLD